MVPTVEQNRTANDRSDLRLSASSLVRAYIDSLPEKVSTREELSSYQFWKSLRTELLVAFLFFVFTSGALFSRTELLPTALSPTSPNSTVPYELLELKSALAIGLTVATLVQCTGHVSGCHLTIAITLGLAASGRVSKTRLVAYLLVQCIASCAGAVVIYLLFGAVPSIAPSSDAISAAQVFGFEFLATFLVVLTYLANCDSTRIDLGFKALSIGLAFTVGHFFAFPSTGASLSPARALAASLLTSSWCLHWIYWVAPLVAGLFGGITYEYIGSTKPLAKPSSLAEGNAGPVTTELKHRFTDKPTPSPSAHSALTLSPSSNYAIHTLGTTRSQSQTTLHLTLPAQANPISQCSPSPEAPAPPNAPLNAETQFGPSVISSADSAANVSYSNGVIAATGNGRW